MKPLLRFSLPVLAAAVLAGCGSGEEGETTVTATTSGVFRDAPVSGLWYQSVTGNNYTDSKGGFEYKPGQIYTFYVGRVKLGSFSPTVDNATVTPANLVPVGTANRETVILNLVRFLMTLDQNQSPGDGIQISSGIGGMDTDALKWFPIDFLSTTALTSTNAQAALVGVTGAGAANFSGITAINGATAYVNVPNAKAHLSDSMQCAYSGAFTGVRMTTGGAVDSRLAFVVDGNGAVKALQFFPSDSHVADFAAPDALDYVDLLPTGSLIKTVASTGNSSIILRYTHSASEADKVSINTTRSGVLSGTDQSFTRLAGKPKAVRRFSGIVSMPAVPTDNDYVFLAETDASNVVTGSVMDVRTGESAALTGSYVAGTGTLTANATLGSRGLELTGALATSTNTWTATFKETLNLVPTNQAFTAVGCKLN